MARNGIKLIRSLNYHTPIFTGSIRHRNPINIIFIKHHLILTTFIILSRERLKIKKI